MRELHGEVYAEVKVGQHFYYSAHNQEAHMTFLDDLQALTQNLQMVANMWTFMIPIRNKALTIQLDVHLDEDFNQLLKAYCAIENVVAILCDYSRKWAQVRDSVKTDC